jgi:hypothetical protein
MLAAPTLFGRPMTIYSAGVIETIVDIIQDGGKTKRQKNITYTRPKAYYIYLSIATFPTPLVSHCSLPVTLYI